MMTPQILMPGLWVYAPDEIDAYYIGYSNGTTAVLIRKVSKNDQPFTDSKHVLFKYLEGIPLNYNILTDSFGFFPSQEREGYVFKELYKELKVPRGDNYEQVKPATNIFIDIDEGGKRFTTYLECGTNRIYLSEISFVHELQLLIYAHTYTFPFPFLNLTTQKSV